MRKHTILGARTLEAAWREYPKNDFLGMGMAIARAHHERWDGSGYPDGLKGEDIPLSARIMALADVYDAMRSVRPYKPSIGHPEIRQAISDASGTHFDPQVVRVFLEIEVMIEEFGRL